MNGSRTGLVLTMFASLMTLGAAPWRALPECINGKWSGITPTDAVGNLTGPADPNDWGCLGGTPLRAAPPNMADGPVPQPPTDFCLYPAAPNPVTSSTRISLAVPRAGHVRVAIYAKQGNGPHNARLVRTLLDGTLAVGLFTIEWNATDDAGARLPADLYRVVMETEDGATCGDVELH